MRNNTQVKNTSTSAMPTRLKMFELISKNKISRIYNTVTTIDQCVEHFMSGVKGWVMH